MANFSRKFLSLTGEYTGGYTSQILEPEPFQHAVQEPRGVIQIHIVSGSVTLQARLAAEAPWFDLRSWTVSAMEELVLPNQLRIVATGEAHCWLGEVR